MEKTVLKMELTEHQKAEFVRLAQAAYDIGAMKIHGLFGLAARDVKMTVYEYDRLHGVYLSWLIDDWKYVDINGNWTFPVVSNLSGMEQLTTPKGA